MTNANPSPVKSPSIKNLELIRQDLCTTIITINGTQALAQLLAESDDENTACIARAACGFIEHICIKLDNIHIALGDLQ
ncbi:hypothetical protein [Gynuella sunshinyii]|uniref:Uncharacterized protein n=1 Tax=Gynuella sunshinyii YC6258 TaxID=1445510 RepID=A0A0C5W087_9GAMM|nr:hypothetical protein [Gynuella sunshinyii]AJQ96094.1 hypothetical Protein YC6258_04058 [Gynuella sunshinyii YC6258]